MPSQSGLFMKRIGIFAGLSDDACDEISGLVHAHYYAKDQPLFKQGDPGDALYLVADGRIRIFLEDARHERDLAFCGEGEILGEMALLTGEPRSASATAATDSRVLVISKEDFDALVGRNPSIMREVAKVLAHRQAQTDAQLLPASNDIHVGTLQAAQKLTIQIDEAEREEEVEEICATDFFEELEQKAKRLRAAQHG